MWISDRYIGRQILSGTLFAIVLLSLLLVLGNIFQKIRSLLVELQAPISILIEFAINVLPVSLIFTVPWAFLSAVLLVFGRLSSDNELNAFRVAGMSLVRIAAPVFFLGLLFSILCVWLNVSVAPRAKGKVNNIPVHVARSMIKEPQKLLMAGVNQTYLKDVKVDTDFTEGEGFKNFHVFLNQSPGMGGAYIHADRAEAVVYEEKQQIHLRLTNAYIEGQRGKKDGAAEAQSDEEDEFIMLSDDLEWMVIDYSDDGLEKPKLGEMSNGEIKEFVNSWPEPAADARPAKVEAMRRARARALAEPARRYASSFACLAFAFIGVPLGIKARRRDTSTGLVLSLVIGACYFVGGNMISDSGLAPWMAWIPNIACVLLGIILFRRARFR
ncbi:LptF/LptG family permease [Haloferula chungangensis]|uniref:LptF/LptG family permease n=1 Tax=Haloferula chungangensis TaxID=1048331 RepID=A0ABW2L4F0_9BACT